MSQDSDPSIEEMELSDASGGTIGSNSSVQDSATSFANVPSAEASNVGHGNGCPLE